MHLKRLEIQGFKSFATKTVLDFLPPKNGLHSITAIVGPNGSGKSNVTDAIRWVMGEQSMKNLRGKKSEDVIFNGSETKGALGVAEVTMVLENDDTATTGLEFPEIVITRRLFRSGESEYLVNNQASRLLDIHLLFARAKFAEGAYSIVSQGMIDKLLTVGPSERKEFFDEACGIKEHQIKQHQASLKLARTEENMKQAETLMNEVEPRLKILARQVKKLEQRQEVELKLTEVQEKYYFILYTKIKTETDALKAELHAVDETYRSSFAELEKIQTELADFARSATRQEAFEVLQSRHQDAMKIKNDLERQLAIIEGQMHTQYSQAGQHNIGWLDGKVVELRSSKERLEADVLAAERDAEKYEHELSLENKKIENISIDQTQLRLKISRLQSRLIQNQTEQSYLQLSGLTAVKAVLEARSRFGKVHGLVAELGEVDEEYRVALEVAAGANLSSIVVENEQVARLAIEYLRENRFGVATFLPLNKIQPRGTYGDADRYIGADGVFGKALSLIRFDNKFDTIFSMIFGSTLVVRDLKVAERIGIGSVRMVTLDGDMVENRGIMRGGFRNRKNNITFSSKLSLSGDDHLAEVQAEINLENHTLQELERTLEGLKVHSVELQVAAQSARAKVALIETEFKNVQRECAQLEHELGLIKASPEQYGEQMQKLSAEKDALQAHVKTHDAVIAQASAEIEDFNRKEEEKKQRIFALQEAMQHKQDAVNRILSTRNDLNIQVARLDTKHEDLAQEIQNDMKISLHSLVERIGPATNETVHAQSVQELAEAIEKLKYQLSLIGGIDEEVITEYTQTKERFDFLDGQLKDLRAATDDLNKMIEELDELMKKKRATAFKKIRKEFDRYFKILFNGGTADLEEVYGEVLVADEMTDANIETHGIAPVTDEEVAAQAKKREKVLTGIDVIANPPGKKVKYLNMLSGGERTLTSIALICAILYHNPSPFVVLDEVEAALDESNTLRFAKIMTELATHSQFIIVTHNRVTMHAADALYGVVMQGDGISKLLSVKMEDVPQYSE